MNQAMPAPSSLKTPVTPESRSQTSGVVVEELSDEEGLWEEDPELEGGMPSYGPFIPDLFTTLPPLRDSRVTKTSELQDTTVQEILPYLAAESGEFIGYNDHGIPPLQRARHVRFLHKSLQTLPSRYVALDAARSWFLYWALCGLRTLGEDVTSYRESLISTVQPMQNAIGGFGSGHGQMSHLAPTYAIVLSLSMVGGTALDVIDRMAMWRWLGALKQPDGGFQMSIGGEEDVRGTYCAAIIISLLDLPLELPHGSKSKSHETDNLLTRIPEYVSRCQTYEGGIASRPDGEAHGAYTFCALACLCILDDPHVIVPKYLDLPALASWLSSRQYAPEGGFGGRTNKLVDACYSHWVGACFPLLDAALRRLPSPSVPPRNRTLFHRNGLIRYILCACQDASPRGGLRDKPSKNSDAYHTCYVLAGLSAVQHDWSCQPRSLSSSGYDTTDLIYSNLSAPFKWHLYSSSENSSLSAEEEGKEWDPQEEEIYELLDIVKPLHPVFVIPDGVAEQTRRHFAAAT